jgi:hypothetical protein
VRRVRRKVEKVDLILLTLPHEVNRCVGAVAVKNEQLVAAN